MVDFTLTDEQKNLREVAHDFAEKEIRPVAWEYDKDGQWPEDIIKKAWEVGLMNNHIPEQYGGVGLGYLDGCVIEEELAWGCSGIQTSVGCNGLATAPLILGGSHELKKEYLGRLTEEPLLASFCLTEPDAGSDVSGMKTTAVKKGDKWVINGSKCFITNGTYANFYTVYAKTDKDAGHRGISAFIVPRDAGVVVDKKEDKMGQRASNTATISFNDVEIPADHLIGEENKGFKLAMMTLDRTRPGVAAMATGIARAAMEFAIDYSKERVQFGVPIAMHQAIQFMIADMATDVEASRLLTWKAATQLDNGERNTLVSSHAKRFAADAAMRVATDAVQVYGGYGFIKEYPVEKLMRDAKIMQLYEGTAQIQRLVIARETLLPRRAETPATANA
ncbi:acyl-CoA dehydrogenase family protein [Conexibacter sp. JD483]|uniref:acyl-CoA dehydrogenase family protein n=1 Tax=unclassified Conexibacter TaxID=2627773 RepID=UPI00271EC660|nr:MULTISPECIES: acyl-CoA dehydrogenase family protein [unclassified Conexibacter]MDO8189211.1 acyl-CoA dehydrogenase family protein [Conexibacter sp. CPCC 205706]MDO8201351.1 acyl-CoA dehydrogenase family protein [Conexibacter sp. CPCC 205762]MDR9372270.1 acyl-CoA dehydrogenase family protein [Conexibacter sp. JD483]